MVVTRKMVLAIFFMDATSRQWWFVPSASQGHRQDNYVILPCNVGVATFVKYWFTTLMVVSSVGPLHCGSKYLSENPRWY
jgi:hypothetical protein